MKKVFLKKPHGKEAYWKVTSPKKGGGSLRRFFQDKTEAQTHLDLQKTELVNFGTAGASFPEKLRSEALAADEILSPLGLSLRDAAKFYADHMKSMKGGIPLATAVELLAKDRESGDYSPVYRQSLSHRLKHFVAAFPDKTSTQVSKGEISTFLRERCKTVETRKSYRRSIKTLYTFLISNHNHTIDPVPDLDKSKGTRETKFTVEILTPEQCSRLLHYADSETLPSLAIAMFCGLRASEIARLNWNKIMLSEKRIVIDASVARKTGSRRVVPIADNCAAWLTPYAKKSGMVQPESFRLLFDSVRIKAGFSPSINKRAANDLEFHNLMATATAKGKKLSPWPSNCLRHSAISYALAESRDESKVASWAGNSPAMIKEHYDGQVMPSAAATFYALATPNNGKKLLNFAA